MSEKDQINRFLFDKTDIRGEILTLDNELLDAVEHQSFPVPLMPLFGEFLAAAALLSEVLKFEGTLTLQARGNADVSIIMAEANHQGDLRGIVRPHPDRDIPAQEFEGRNLKSLVGDGVLTITIDPTKGQRYQGIIPIEHPSLAECLDEYFEQSEQLPTNIQLYSNQHACGGLFLQALPAQEVIDPDRRDDIWTTCCHLARTLKKEEMFSLSNSEILTRLFHEMQCRVFPPKRLQFHCSCTRERSANALQSLGIEDAHALLQERDVIQIDCQFCGKSYAFSAPDLPKIFPEGHSWSLH